MLVKLEQPEKAEPSMVVMLSGSAMLVKLRQPKNTPAPMLARLSGLEGVPLRKCLQINRGIS